MVENLVVRRLLWALTSLLFIVGCISLPVVGDEDGVRAGSAAGGERVGEGPQEADAAATTDPAAGDTAEAPAEGAVVTTTTGATTGATAATTAPAPGAPTAVAAPSTTTTALPPSPPELGAPADPGPPVPPRAGLYRYRTVGGSEGGQESTTRVEERSRAGDEVRQSVTTTGGRLTSTSDVVWRPDGVRTLRSTLTFGDRSGDCDWEPDVVDALFPLGPGATWRTESRCSVTGLTPTPILLERVSSAKVLELRRAQVAGRTVDVWAIERTERLSGGGMSEEITLVALFSPKHGIDVELRGARAGEEYRRELLNLEPEPA